MYTNFTKPWGANSMYQYPIYYMHRPYNVMRWSLCHVCTITNTYVYNIIIIIQIYTSTCLPICLSLLLIVFWAWTEIGDKNWKVSIAIDRGDHQIKCNQRLFPPARCLSYCVQCRWLMIIYKLLPVRRTTTFVHSTFVIILLYYILGHIHQSSRNLFTSISIHDFFFRNDIMSPEIILRPSRLYNTSQILL